MAQEYVLVRLLPGGQEVVEEVIPVTDATQADVIEQTRNNILASARGKKLANPAFRYVLYGPTEEDTPRTVDDRVWDSSTDL